MSISDNCVCDHQPSLLLVPWWGLGHLPITAKCLNSFSTCSGDPLCAQLQAQLCCQSNRSTAASQLPGRREGPRRWTLHPTQRAAEPHWISGPCRVFTVASVQAGSHRLGPQTVWCLRVLEEVASLLQRAGRILRKLAPMTWCSQCSSYRFSSLCLLLFETPTQAVESWDPFVPSPES